MDSTQVFIYQKFSKEAALQAEMEKL